LKKRVCFGPNGNGEASTIFSFALPSAMHGKYGCNRSRGEKVKLETMLMKIVLTSILVDDQDKALRFYRDILGFKLKHDIPMGAHRWLTLVSPEQPDGVELVLEPDQHPAAQPFKSALVADGIPCTSFGVEDVRTEHDRLTRLGVRFTQPPVNMGPVTTAVFEDTCGNLLQIAQRH
jgi:catechol 2,3-dioxygenase-like lactoylglutathione lyase family enzyme